MLNTKIKQSGFTIVELLIVIVVIAILAAISIVAYNGIQARGKTSAVQSLASSIAKKTEIYNTDPDTSGYPATLYTLTNAAATTTYAVPASSVTLATATPTSAANEKTIAFFKCGTGSTTTAPTTAANVTTQTGVEIKYWDFQSTSVKTIAVGITSGLAGTYNIGCGPAQT